MNGPLAALSSLARLVNELPAGDRADAATVKACCAAAYGVDLIGLFLGESYHPGGADLTRRLAEMMALQPTERVLDVAAGIGTTALLLAAERDVEVVGVDLGERQVAAARQRAMAVDRLAGRVRFEVGDAERLPVDDGAFDAVVCECAFCTFPDKHAAAAEITRALRPGGRVGISDVWLEPDRLDPELAGLAGRVACLADARPIPELRQILEDHGFTVDHVERHDDALVATIEQVEARLRALRLVDLPVLRAFNLRRGVELARRAADVGRRGDAGYVLLVATKR
jgi:SAM-dependent methyltransferase